MNHLLTIIILIAVTTSASADMTGLWKRDWQSAGTNCQPSTLTIDEVSQGVYNVSYVYTSLDLVSCGQNFSGSYVSNLTQNTTTGAWVDSQGIQLTYGQNITDGIITYTKNNSETYALYDRTGGVIPETVGLGLVGGVWNNPTYINATNRSACCMPTSLYVAPQSGIVYPEGEIYVTFNYSNNTCAPSNTLQNNLIIDAPLIDRLNWSSIDINIWAITSLILDPSSSSNQLTVEYQYFNLSNLSNATIGNTCFYSYQRSQPQLINGTWVPDWQSYYYNGPSSYQISIVNDTYMISTLNYSNGVVTGVVSVNSQNQYYDNALDSLFEYDNKTQSLLTVYSPGNDILFTKNGSLFSDNMYAANWNNPESLDANPLPASCCLPDFLEIGPSPYTANMYSIAYFFPDNYTENEACTSIASHFIGDYELLMTLEAFPPSFTNLNWVDNYGSSYSFTGNASSKQLVVSNFSGTACSFKMSYTNETNPPGPLSAGWMGIDIKFIVIMSISMIFACL